MSDFFCKFFALCLGREAGTGSGAKLQKSAENLIALYSMLSNLLYIFNVSCLVLDGVNEPLRQRGMLRILEVLR